MSNGQVQVPPGDYGPVAPLMTAMLSLGQSGLLEGALAAEQSGSYYPYHFDFTRELLYFSVASPYMDTPPRISSSRAIRSGASSTRPAGTPAPGGWRRTSSSTSCRRSPNSDNADLIVVTLMMVIFALLLLLPVIPLLNRLPHLLKVYRLIWWDWYRGQGGTNGQSGRPAGTPRA